MLNTVTKHDPLIIALPQLATNTHNSPQRVVVRCGGLWWVVASLPQLTTTRAHNMPQLTTTHPHLATTQPHLGTTQPHLTTSYHNSFMNYYSSDPFNSISAVSIWMMYSCCKQSQQFNSRELVLKNTRLVHTALAVPQCLDSSGEVRPVYRVGWLTRSCEWWSWQERGQA